MRLSLFVVLVAAGWLFSSIPGHCTSPLNTQLLRAVNSGQTGQVRDLLRRGANPNARYYRSDQSSTVLIESAALGNLPVVQALLAHGARVNARGYTCMTGAPRGDGDYQRSTALIEACLRGDNDQIVSALLAHGADVNAADKSGGTALSNSLWLSNGRQAQILLAHGAHADQETRRRIAPRRVTQLKSEEKPGIVWGNGSREFAYNLECLTRQSLLDKGKPGETQGRKAKGLRTKLRLILSAWLPCLRKCDSMNIYAKSPAPF